MKQRIDELSVLYASFWELSREIDSRMLKIAENYKTEHRILNNLSSNQMANTVTTSDYRP